jgi:hypothetical protein
MLKTDFHAVQAVHYAPEGLLFSFVAPLEKIRAPLVGSVTVPPDVVLAV